MTIDIPKKSGNIDELPEEITDEFFDKINHIKKMGAWEKFKEVGVIYYTDDNLALHYAKDGSIVCIKELNKDETLIYHIEFEKHENK